MFNRNVLKRLKSWSISSRRKPLVIRGARQTGKTSVVRMFSAEFDHFIELNLERKKDRILFEKDLSVKDILETISLRDNFKWEGKSLIFIGNK